MRSNNIFERVFYILVLFFEVGRDFTWLLLYFIYCWSSILLMWSLYACFHQVFFIILTYFFTGCWNYKF